MTTSTAPPSSRAQGSINALELVGKHMEEVKIVLNGAGAASIATADLYVALGARAENIIMADTKGVIYTGRTAGMNEYKERYAVDTPARTLADALVGADVFIGLSVANVLTQEMVRSMATDPIIFAMANPDPEITYEEAQAARSDIIFGTGRSDYPNQVNNVLGFPFIFRGALDVHARAINMEMKLAATRALAALAKEDVPDSVIRAYGLDSLRFSREYIIPKPLDPRVLMWVAPAVAKAAMETGVARRQIDLDEYMNQLAARLGKGAQLMRLLEMKARKAPKRVVYGEGEDPKVIRAAHEVAINGIAHAHSPGQPGDDRVGHPGAGHGLCSGDRRPQQCVPARGLCAGAPRAAPAQGCDAGLCDRSHAPGQLLRPYDGRPGRRRRLHRRHDLQLSRSAAPRPAGASARRPGAR